VLEPPLDAYTGILKTDQELIHIARRRGGIGFDISNIRPKGLPTNNAAKTTDGIAVFMERFSNSCREVAQGGRRGALLLSISCHHPEILTFIKIKKDRKKVTGANISIRFSDEFMEAVKSGGKVNLRWPVEAEKPVISVWEDANVIWNEFTSAAHDSAEPGALFWDNALNNTPAQIYKDFGFQHSSTNPCGEIVLSPYDSCRLLLINLTSCVSNPFEKNAKFDFTKFSGLVMKGQRLMDDLVDLEAEAVDRIIAKIKSDPEPDDTKYIELNLWLKIKKACLDGRRTGLGITALGDCLAMLGVIYGSDQSITMVEKIYKQLAINSYKSSCIMASERGPFPIFNPELEVGHPFLQRIFEADSELFEMYKKYGRRNIANLTTAPAGTVSIMTQTTSGIEPAFLVSYKRRKKIISDDPNAQVDFTDHMGDKWQEFIVYHPGFKKWMEISGKTSVEDSPYWKATSNDVDWVKSVDLQAAAQKWVCHAISKTCNVPNSTSVDVVKEIYMRAWEKGCKGFTIYRDGCRTGVLISNEEKVVDGRPTEVSRTQAPKRPQTLSCDVHSVTVQGEPWILAVGLLKGEPYEIFGGPATEISIPRGVKEAYLNKVKQSKNVNRYDLIYNTGSSETLVEDFGSKFENKMYGTFTRTISLALRHGAAVEHVVNQLAKDSSEDLLSFSKVISRVLKKYIRDDSKMKKKVCDKCGSINLKFQDGCPTCLDCGNSKCS
jgi:ribonucleoside-diphosphate reductase alpha chain